MLENTLQNFEVSFRIRNLKMKYNYSIGNWGKYEKLLLILSTIISRAKATLFIHKSDERLYIKTENEILLYTNKIMYIPNNDTTKWQNEKYLIHKKAQHNQQVLKELHSANPKKTQSY